MDSAALTVLLAGVSNSCGAICTHPVDVVKLHMQLQGGAERKGGALSGAAGLVRARGAGALLRGVEAAVVREMFYAGLRLGCYDTAKESVAAKLGHGTLQTKMVAGALSGAFGSAMGSPTELLKVRMQQSKSGRSMFATVGHITRTEGLAGWYRGAVPFVQRSSLLTMAQIASYDHSKHALIAAGAKEGPLSHFVASMFAGFCASAASTPFDFVKSRLMSGRPEFRGQSTLQCLRNAIKEGGILAPYRGFIPNWMRIGPHTVVTFLVYERLRLLAGLNPV